MEAGCWWASCSAKIVHATGHVSFKRCILDAEDGLLFGRRFKIKGSGSSVLFICILRHLCIWRHCIEWCLVNVEETQVIQVWGFPLGSHPILQRIYLLLSFVVIGIHMIRPTPNVLWQAARVFDLLISALFDERLFLCCRIADFSSIGDGSSVCCCISCHMGDWHSLLQWLVDGKKLSTMLCV